MDSSSLTKEDHEGLGIQVSGVTPVALQRPPHSDNADELAYEPSWDALDFVGQLHPKTIADSQLSHWPQARHRHVRRFLHNDLHAQAREMKLEIALATSKAALLNGHFRAAEKLLTDCDATASKLRFEPLKARLALWHAILSLEQGQLDRAETLLGEASECRTKYREGEQVAHWLHRIQSLRTHGNVNDLPGLREENSQSPVDWEELYNQGLSPSRSFFDRTPKPPQNRRDSFSTHGSSSLAEELGSDAFFEADEYSIDAEASLQDDDVAPIPNEKKVHGQPTSLLQSRHPGSAVSGPDESRPALERRSAVSTDWHTQ